MVNPFYKVWLVIRATLFWIFFLPMLLLLATLLSLLFFAPLGVRVGVVHIWIAYSLFCQQAGLFGKTN